jgi:hypothetical protein
MTKHFRKKASALVTTLFVVVVLSTIIVAFLASMSIERRIAKSMQSKYQADLAAEAGANMISQAIAESIGTNAGFLVLSTNIQSSLHPVFYIQTGGNSSASNVLPLISGNLTNYLSTRTSAPAALTNYLAQATNTNSSNAINVNKMSGGFRILANSGPTNFNAPWIFFTNSTGNTNMRVAFFVIDEQSKLNLAQHGWSTNTNRSGWSNAPALVPISIPGNTNLLNTNSAFAFASATNKEPWIRNYAQIFPDRADFEAKKHLYTYVTGPSQDFISRGFTNTNGTFSNYAQANLPKWNINDRATNTNFGGTAAIRASNIATIINTNLPNFGKRDIAMSNGLGGNYFRYLERIAASIVDYIDSDAEVTVLADASPLGEPAGKELAPLITCIAEKYNWVSETGAGTSWTNQITQTVFVQVWNPYQTNISGNLTFELSSFRPINMPGAILSNMATNTGTSAIALRPNEFKVYQLGIATNTVVTTAQASANTANYPKMTNSQSANILSPLHSRFEAKWNGILFDRTPNLATNFFDILAPGLHKANIGGSTTLISLNGVTNRYSINYPSIGSDPSSLTTPGYRAVADPRQNFIAAYNWESSSQANAGVLWNGRNNLAISTGAPQDYSTTWAARDFMRASPTLGTFINLNTSTPTNASSPWTSANATNAPFYLRNGKMESIGELGNIYDPAQLNDVGFSTSAGSPTSWYASGGGRTLRLGISEFDYPNTNTPPTGTAERLAPNWNSPGYRSTHLLDLFTVSQTNSNGVPTNAPKININTASQDVLTALFYNLSQNADLAFTNSILTANAASNLASLVISNRPFYNLSDFYKITPQLLNPANYSPTLGNSTTTNIAAINDAGREQLLAAIIELVDTQSRNFKVISIGQAIDQGGKVLAEAVQESIITLDSYPKTNTSGAIEYRTRAAIDQVKKY